MIGSSAAASATGQQDRQATGNLWAQAVATQRKQMDAIRTIEGRYRQRFLSPILMKWTEYDAQFALVGGLLFEQESYRGKIYHRQQAVQDGGTELPPFESAFDGIKVRARTNRGVLVEADRSRPVLGCELPHQVADLGLLRHLPGGADDRRAYILRTAERRDDGLVDFVFDHRESNRWIQLTCDPGTAHLPVRILHGRPNTAPAEDNVAGVVEEIEYISIPAADGALYYPIKAKSYLMVDGELTLVKSVEAVPESLRINVPIPNTRFRLAPRDDETVYNPAAGRVLRSAQTASNSTTPAPTGTSAVATTDWSDHWHLLLPVLGLLVLGTGIVLILRNRRIASR